MAYFNFENGKTALNDTNLNGMQTLIKEDITKVQTLINNYIEKSKETVLYENITGNDGTVTLTDSASNYKYIELYYSKGGVFYGQNKIYDTTKDVPLTVIYAENNNIQIQCKVVRISNKSITHVKTNGINFSVGDPNVNVFTNDGTQIFIHKVIGYK